MRAARWAALLAVIAALLAVARPAAADEPAPLRVGLTARYPPFNYTDESGKLTGFDVEIAEAVCAEIGRRCHFEILAWDGILAALLADKIDAIIGSMAITEERSRVVSFSAPYYESGAQLFVKEGLGGEATREPGFRVGVVLGTTYETFVREALPAAEVRTYKGDPEIFQDLAAGRLDGVVTDRLAGAWLNIRRGAGLERSGEPLYEERIGIPVRPADAALLGDIDRAVARIRGSPAYGRLMERYFGEGAAAPASARGLDWGRVVPLLLRGFAATARAALTGVGLGCALAIALAAAVLAARGAVRRALVFAVDFIRATPFLVQLFAIYFGLPAAGVELGAWTAAILAIALHSAAYLAEVVKTAYLGVPPGQHQAAATLGLGRLEALRYVIVPQMLPQLTAPALNTVVAMIKDSAVISVIGVYELTLQAQQLVSATFRPLELYLAAALLYFALTYPLLLLGRLQERRARARGLLA